MIDFFLNIIKDSVKGAYSEYKNRLAESENEILLECSVDGEMHLLKTDMFGTWLRASKKDFFDKDDRAIQAIYLEAFESLCKRGYVRQEGGSLFRLTGTGFSKARELSKEAFQKEDNGRICAPPLSEDAASLLAEIDGSSISKRKGITICDDSQLGAGKCHYFPYLYSAFEKDPSQKSVSIIDFSPLWRLVKELIDHAYLAKDSSDGRMTLYARTEKL
jgi:hypothetical protein